MKTKNAVVGALNMGGQNKKELAVLRRRLLSLGVERRRAEGAVRRDVERIEVEAVRALRAAKAGLVKLGKGLNKEAVAVQRRILILEGRLS